MDLRGKQITVGELLDNPKSKAVFQRRFGSPSTGECIHAQRGQWIDQVNAAHTSLRGRANRKPEQDVC